ncbi:GTPase Era [Candidatus Walczuchella monophlebidarum]|uniref:GTPase Era n=1 Tax=Candidatus Walczuchella monophlebidarum TaxID=1415657 RepID=A0A068DWY4_9FLAO|nr:GTPase Era [Candidatus Walczuchella monophlebidarum]AID37543.1 ribosome biogenesis GTPase Era [Candidatus Walczuchella monophlebidarum]
MVNHKSGFVTIIGNPNVGKSTLMNVLVGERLFVVTPKVQTTRHRIIGIVNNDNYQIIFSDTPGILEASYTMQNIMMGFVKKSIEDADILILMVEGRKTMQKNRQILKIIKNNSRPLLLLINKIDCIDKKTLKDTIYYWGNIFTKAEILPISATKKKNIQILLKKVIHLLPEHKAYYPKDEITDRSERFFVSEIIREKIFFLYRKEIPYSSEVSIDSFEDKESLLKVYCSIHLERNSQKEILIGNKGKAIKKLSIISRKSLERFFQKRIFLHLYVKINKNWRSNKSKLKRLGYFLS